MKAFRLVFLLATFLFFKCSSLTIGHTKPHQYQSQPQPASSFITHVDHHQQPNKPFTLYVDIEADNDLYPFAGRNIRQLQTHGSDANINILIQLNIHLKGQNKVTKRFYIEQNKLIQVGPDTQMDGGDPNTLIDFVRWGLENYPADHICLDLWNHGTGFIDPIIPHTINPAELFYFNTQSKMIELDRRIGFIDFVTAMVEQPKEVERGICFDQTTGNYLNNSKLHYALNEITQLLGRKIDIIFFDACLMQMWEVLRMIAPFADYAVGSQELELGTGYNYAFVLEPFTTQAPSPYEFARHTVYAFERAYGRITNDYTQSAVDLNKMNELDKNINGLADVLTEGLQKQFNGSVKEVIHICRNKQFCTQFDEPSYIDLYSFLNNLQKNYIRMNLKNPQETKNFSKKLQKQIENTKSVLDTMIIAKCHGRSLPSGGMSIYFPERRIHPSCYNVPGTDTNRWLHFISSYLNT